jgi:hypothetical protein
MKYQRLTIHFTLLPIITYETLTTASDVSISSKVHVQISLDITARTSTQNMALVVVPVLRFGRLVADSVVNIGKYGSTRFVKRLSSSIRRSCNFGKNWFYDIAY